MTIEHLVGSAHFPDVVRLTLTLDAEYELDARLGAGSFGAVYRARALTLPASAPVYHAVKAIRKDPSRPDSVETVRREAMLHTRVTDIPGVVNVHGVWEDDEHVYIMLNYCAGGELYDWIEEDEFQGDDKHVRDIFVQILDAVRACHKKAVYHRDLKPENILCNEDGTKVYIADFGLVTDRKRSIRFGVGSAAYMSPGMSRSPDQCIGGEYNHTAYLTRSSDIWALGIILVNLIAGRNPWRTARLEDRQFWRFLGSIDEETNFWEHLGVSEELAVMLDRVFEMEPEMRLSIEEMREEVLSIRAFFAPQPVDTDPEKAVWRVACPLDASLGLHESEFLHGH
ncbi:kinase-like protein [Obba rivulosa]|uniref:Kinase-like protein n=1 Tax=Obba rivulosa TaxID=1052685 RepID=A0A8E2AQ63_9APHY|nr:kinase-like protein [Obba rivulosa]